MRAKQITILFLCLFPLVSFAQSINKQCKTYDFLSKGFNFSDYEKCNQRLAECPQQNGFPELSCVQKISEKNLSCQQMQQISTVLQMPISELKATKIGKVVVIDKIFIADGQHQYYFITPQGCLIDSIIDPRDLDTKLAKKYKNTSFFIVNGVHPQARIRKDGFEEIQAVLRITDHCLACPVIGWAYLTFTFSKDGEWQGVLLSRFKVNSSSSQMRLYK